MPILAFEGAGGTAHGASARRLDNGMSSVTRVSAEHPGDDAGASAIRMPAMANRDFRMNRQKTVRRHTKNVKRMRILLPAVGGLLALSIIVLTILESLFLNPLVIVKSIFEGDGLVMTNPKLAGHSEKGRAYVLQAREARQPLNDTGSVTLIEVKAFAEISDDDEADMTAATGLYKTEEEFLTLRKDIVVVTKSGYTIRSQAADIDLAAGTLNSSVEVIIKSDELDLRSDSAEVTEQGKVIKFKGNVRIVWKRKPEPGSNPASNLGSDIELRATQ